MKYLHFTVEIYNNNASEFIECITAIHNVIIFIIYCHYLYTYGIHSGYGTNI